MRCHTRRFQLSILIFSLEIHNFILLVQGFCVVSSTSKKKNTIHFLRQGDENYEPQVVAVAPELDPSHVEYVNSLVEIALGDRSVDDDNNNNSNSNSNKSMQMKRKDERIEKEKRQSLSKKDLRYTSARSMATKTTSSDNEATQESGDSLATLSSMRHQNHDQHQLVYGELSIPVLAKILDAVQVQKGDQFLDVGSGDGALVLGASLLYPMHIKKSVGLEILPGLWKRSQQHCKQLQEHLNSDDKSAINRSIMSAALKNVDFVVGDIYEATMENADDLQVGENASTLKILQKTTLAVCFATTWSQANNIVGGQNYANNSNDAPRSRSTTSLDGRKLPALSAALAVLPVDARIVIVDGKLNEEDGYRWEGDLKVYCPDTAPHSIASLYRRI